MACNCSAPVLTWRCLWVCRNKARLVAAVKTRVGGGGGPARELIESLENFVGDDFFDFDGVLEVGERLRDLGEYDAALVLTQTLIVDVFGNTEPAETAPFLVKNLYLQAAVYQAVDRPDDALQASSLADFISRATHIPSEAE